MERRAPDDTLTILMGVGVFLGVAAFGGVFVLLLRERKPSPPPLPAGLQLGNGGNGTNRQASQPIPIPVVQVANTQTRLSTKPSITRTVSLPTETPALVLSAGSDRHWTAQLRNVGPPGSIAYVSMDPTNLSFPSRSAALGAGGPPLDITLRPRDALYAIGNVAGVQLTLVAGEEAA